MMDIKAINREYLFSFSYFIFWLVTCSLSWGQDNQKRLLKKEEYSLWSNLATTKISDHGNWVSYGLQYQSEKDTLFVKNTSSNLIYSFPKGMDGKFNNESQFACKMNDTVILQNLNSGSNLKIPNVQNFFFSADHKFLLLINKKSASVSTIEIKNPNGETLEQIVDISRWYLDPLQKVLVYSTVKNENYSIGYIQLESGITTKTIINGSIFPFQNFVYKDNTIAFIQNIKNGPLLFRYDIRNEKLQNFEAGKQKNFTSDMKISSGANNKLLISDDGNCIFFWLSENGKNLHPIDPSAVEIWNTRDRLLFDHKKDFGDYTKEDKMAVWSIKENTFLQLTDKMLPRVFLSTDYSHAFLYDPVAYEPQNNFDSPYDLYITDIKSGKRKCILEHYSSSMTPVGSPDGAYLCYAKDSHLWIYDIKGDTHTNITAGHPDSFFDKETDMPAETEPYGIGGWTKDGRSIILYDKYDLWQFSLDGIFKNRITYGRETQKIFRIRKSTSGLTSYFMIDSKEPINLSTGLVLEIKNENFGSSGFCKWNTKVGIFDMIWNNTKINQINKATDEDRFLYIEQNYEMPPKLMLYDQTPKEIFQSNKQQQKFFWGKNEAIQYSVNGRIMQGILYYPAGYSPSLKYPMIVHIYERQNQYFHNYENPTLYSPDGFSLNNYTAQGYFVLLPDMVFEIGNIGESITKSVLSAVDTVIEKGLVDPKKIGLIGHSFGGYEADLIITQTNRFAAAVAGSAWTDLVSSYLYMGGTFRRPDFYRAELDQLRIGKSLFEDTTGYLKNSPVLLAANVKTPLLGWTGQEDRHIHSLQSMEFYMALRRLNKTHTLLVYPDERHNLTKPSNQKDLNVRIEQWFDYYLKNGKLQDWMKADLY